MRIGKNPTKDAGRLQDYKGIRVIVPVHIPSKSGYFKHSLEILGLCLESIHITCGARADVTIVSNDCREEVREHLLDEFARGWIDQLLFNVANRGKVDAIMSVARGCHEELITFADCDVLFAPNWIDSICDVFSEFPECGAVLQPNPVMYKRHTTATLLGGFLNREIRTDNVVPDEDLERFARSVGRPDMYEREHKEMQMVVRRSNVTACVGGGHFAFTIRRKILAGVPDGPSLHSLGQYGVEHWMDIPADKLGFWRLATPTAYAYHMGNVPESWMYEELERCRRAHGQTSGEHVRVDELPTMRRPWISRISWPARRHLVRVMRKLGLLRIYSSEGPN